MEGSFILRHNEAPCRVISAKVPSVCKMSDIYNMKKLPRFIKILVHAERIWCIPLVVASLPGAEDKPPGGSIKYKLRVNNNMIDGCKKDGDIIKVGPERKVYDYIK